MAQQQTTTTPGTGTAATTTTPSLTPSPPLTPQEQQQQIRLQNVIASTTLNLQETQKQIGGVVFTPRWSQPVWVNANSVAVLVAYCLPGEFADAGQEILGGFGLEVLESYGVALPQGGFMAWMAVVGNEDIQNRRLPAALGVMCASDLNRPETRVLSPEKQQEINNINEQFVNIQNTQINDIDNLINVINTVTTTTTTTTTTPATPPTPPGQNRTGVGAAGTTTLAAAPAQQQDTAPPTIVGVEDEVYEPISEQSSRVTYALRAQDNVDGTAKLEADGITVTQDNVGGNIAISCDKPSGSEFVSDETILTCVATDQAGNAFTDSFILTGETGSNGTANGTTGGAAGTTTLAAAPVQDTTPPTIIVPEDMVVQATSEQGAVVTYTVTTQDNVDGTITLEADGSITRDNAADVFANIMPEGIGQNQEGIGQINNAIQICEQASGSLFPIGETTVKCTARDSSGNEATQSFTVTVNPPPGQTPSQDNTGTGGSSAASPEAPPEIVDEGPSSSPGVPLEIPSLQAPPVIVDEGPSSSPQEPPAEEGEGEEEDGEDGEEEPQSEDEDEGETSGD
jgi:hypothetical protein